MPYIETTAATKIKHLTKRIRLIPGGTSASKTVSILLYLIALAQSDTKPTLTSVVSESFPHLKRGAIRDFLSIMQTPTSDNSTAAYFEPERWNKTDSIYTFPLRDPKTGKMKDWTGSKIEFFSGDQPSKVRGPRRDRLFGNEVNNMPKETWDQLVLRTREFAIADWNPVSDFYMYEDYGLDDSGPVITSTDDRVDTLILTYKDNEALEPAIVEEIERRAASNPSWGRVYAEGKRGEIEARIYKDWKIIDEIPHEARLERRGMDFGFTNDPTAIVDVYYYNGGWILDERLYRKGMLNSDIAAFVKNFAQPNTLIMADSADPGKIAELQALGVPLLGVTKKGGNNKSYKRYSIENVQEKRISVTKRSVNLIKEYRQYLWLTDKDGKTTNEPEDGFDHALDATRYAFDGLRPKPTTTQKASSGNLMKLFNH